MTLDQLVAYLKYRAAQNKEENVQTNPQVAGSASGGNEGLYAALLKYGPKAIKWGYNAYNQPASAFAAGSAPTAAGGAGTIGASGVAEGAGLAGGYGTAAAGAGTGVTMAEAGGAAGGGSLGGMGAAGMTAGGIASLLAPVFMAWQAYTAGSGQNDPLIRKYQTQGAGRMLSDILAGRKVDPASTYQNYFVPEKRVAGTRDPRTPYGGEEFVTPGTELIDPRGYSPNDLWHFMHQRGKGNQNRLDTDSSGFSDEEIDRLTGLDRGGLSKAIGEEVPDWSTIKYADWTSPGTDKQKALDTEWGALEAQNRLPYEQQVAQRSVQTSNADLTTAQMLWQKQKEKEELEKLLGYKLGGINYGTF